MVAAYLFYRQDVHRHPANYPWTPLSLTDPIGVFTAAKLTGLDDELARCSRLMRAARFPVRTQPSVSADGGRCGYRDGVSAPLPGPPLTTSCSVAAALAVWDRDVVQPAARKHLGSAATAYDNFGSYNCRRMYGRDDMPFSEHATADAVDIAGFRLANGKRISIVAGWNRGSPDQRAFLREVRDGACRLFATTLSPDYNAAHHDHLHLDQAERGRWGASMCR